MKIAIIGTRTFKNYGYFEQKLNDILRKNSVKPTIIITGGARGVDSLAENFAIKHNIPVQIFKPNWNIGKYAGLIRNTLIIENADIVIAFWNSKSKGTLDSIKKAQKSNKQLFIELVN